MVWFCILNWISKSHHLSLWFCDLILVGYRFWDKNIKNSFEAAPIASRKGLICWQAIASSTWFLAASILCTGLFASKKNKNQHRDETFFWYRFQVRSVPVQLGFFFHRWGPQHDPKWPASAAWHSWPWQTWPGSWTWQVYGSEISM